MLALRTLIACALGFLILAGSAANAEDAAQSIQQRQEEDLRAAFEAVERNAIHGPQRVPLLTQGSIELPKGYVFVPQPTAGQLSRALGNPHSPVLAGMLFDEEGSGWMAYLDYIGDGYIKDDDALTWNANDLLQGLKDGTEAANGERQERGFPPLEVTGWAEKPAYDAKEHRLVWSAIVRQKSADSSASSVNYNTYALGREGHFELNLVTAADRIEEQKIHARTLLAALAFDEGKRYQDFNAETDHVAEYGLAALVGGIAAKKLGLLAVIAAFFAKFAKLFAVAAIAGLVGLKRLFTGRRQG